MTHFSTYVFCNGKLWSVHTHSVCHVGDVDDLTPCAVGTTLSVDGHSNLHPTNNFFYLEYDEEVISKNLLQIYSVLL